MAMRAVATGVVPVALPLAVAVRGVVAAVLVSMVCRPTSVPRALVGILVTVAAMTVSVAMTVAVAMAVAISIVGVPIRRVADGAIGILFDANDAAAVFDGNLISCVVRCSDESDRATDDRIIARQVDKHITFSPCS